LSEIVVGDMALAALSDEQACLRLHRVDMAFQLAFR
jgi:hypothetical protein